MGSYGQLGLGDFLSSTTPASVQNLEAVEEVACGLYHTVAVLRSGDMAAWGWGEYGQLGQDDGGEDSAVPKIIMHLKGYKVLQTACGLYHSMALMEVPECVLS